MRAVPENMGPWYEGAYDTDDEGVPEEEHYRYPGNGPLSGGHVVMLTADRLAKQRPCMRTGPAAGEQGGPSEDAAAEAPPRHDEEEEVAARLAFQYEARRTVRLNADKNTPRRILWKKKGVI